MSAVEPSYIDAFGKRHKVPARTLKAIRTAIGDEEAGGVVVTAEGGETDTGPAQILLENGSTRRTDRLLPRDVPAGYHTLKRKGRKPVRLIVAPASCHLPRDLKIWGWAIQLYAARSRRSWGIGDLADLSWLGRWGARAGARIALLNPLAGAAPTIPQQPSPYFPTSRRFRNPLYLRVEEVTGARQLRDLSAIAERGRALNAERLIDRDEVFRLKMGALEQIWESTQVSDVAGFDDYLRDQGRPLEEFAAFCVLAEQFGPSWRDWPVEYRHPASRAVRAFARRKGIANRIRFHQWLQFEIDRQLARASRAVPVMQDLPIGFDAAGADAWAFQDVLAEGITVGAPPDEFNTKGQDWGLPPFVPSRLRAAGYEPFIETIRACLRHAGGLRIDHVMGLFRLFWIPSGMSPADGAYVRSAASELLAIIAIESRRARAVIVGEDLGTVEEEARAELMARKIMSYRLLWFEKDKPSKYPERALAAVTTHDLPTIAGLWNGSDLAAQKKLGLSPNEKGTREIRNRVKRLTKATAQTPIQTIIARVHEALAAAPSTIVTATVDDALAVEERPNMPATTGEWPNWSLALPKPIEDLERLPLPRRIARALNTR